MIISHVYKEVRVLGGEQQMLVIKPIDLKSANAFVLAHHRHNGKVLVHRFSIACYDGDRLCGVAICGNPSARKLDTGEVIEVKRVCTDGTRNACSILYGRCARIAKEMGWSKIITYTLDSESGVSLRASGWQIEAENVGGASWNVPSRPRIVREETLWGERIAAYPIDQKKVRWSKKLTL
jgi:hypothetical protein